MIYIRVDMNPVIATGHLMRCLSIAEAIVERGEQVTFISADEYPTAMLSEKGYKHVVLGTDWQDMNGEIDAMKSVIADGSANVLLVDSYQVTEEYLRELDKVIRVFYIDDLNFCKHYITGLINYACYAGDMEYGNESREFYMGCSYAPLRKMFRNCSKRVATEKAKKLLIMSGGTDPCDMLVRILKVIRDSLIDRFDSITLICGRYFSNEVGLKNVIAESSEGFKDIVHIIPSVENMRECFEQADLVISAGGTTMYEVCAIGVPTISFAIVDNQLQNVEWLDRHNIVPCAGDARVEGTEKNIVSIIEQMDDIEIMNGYSKRMQSLVDGQGAVRLADILIEYDK